MKQLHVRLSEEDDEALMVIVELSGLSQSEVARRAIREMAARATADVRAFLIRREQAAAGN